jgi:hypothetical protein
VKIILVVDTNPVIARLMIRTATNVGPVSPVVGDFPFMLPVQSALGVNADIPVITLMIPMAIMTIQWIIK